MLSALELEFRVHWKEFDDLYGKWDGLRVRRLCDILGLTLPELAALTRIPAHQLRKWGETEKFPGCVKTILNLMERSAYQTYLGKVYTTSMFPHRL